MSFMLSLSLFLCLQYPQISYDYQHLIFSCHFKQYLTGLLSVHHTSVHFGIIQYEHVHLFCDIQRHTKP
jgi:hypothetical protein